MEKEARPYQTKAVRDLLRAISPESSRRRVVYQLATGGGKTNIAGEIAQDLASHGKNVLVLCHKDYLVDQFIDTLTEVGLAQHTGIIKSGRAPTPWQPFQIASIPTLYRRPNLQLEPDVIIVDECHHARAKTWEDTISRFGDVPLIGLTATPTRKDGKGLGEIFDNLICGPPISELVDDGYLALMRTFDIRSSLDITGVRDQGGDYSVSQQAKRVTEKVVGDAVKAYLKHIYNVQTIFFGVDIDHSKRVCEGLRSHGIMAEHLDGKDSSDRRKSVLNAFRQKHIQVVCNSHLLMEGLDVPSCVAVMIGRHTKSVTDFLQMAGRAMRPEPGKVAICMDLCGNTYRPILGRPDDDRHWSLGTDGSRLDEEVVPVQRLSKCRECNALFKVGTKICPACGAQQGTGGSLPVIETEVELVEVTSERNRKRSLLENPEPKKNKTGIYDAIKQSGGQMDKLLEIAERNGYDAGWASVVKSHYDMMERDKRNKELHREKLSGQGRIF